jgi:hypothetical protein
MWYDKYPGVPPRGSPLETLFVLVNQERLAADLLATKALVLSALSDTGEEAKNAIKSFQSYADAMFPFLEAASDVDANAHRQKLLDHVKYPLRIDLASVKKERADKAKAKALSKYKISRVQIPGVKGNQ